jgi:hypothetical protein
MNQKERSLLYRGTFLLVLAGFVVSRLAKSGEPWVRHLGDIGSVVLFLGMAAFILFVVVKRQRQVLNAPISNKPLPPSLESPHLRRLARIAVLASVLLFVAFFAVLMFVEPPKKCPNWHLPSNQHSPIWPLALWSALVLAGLTFIIVRWRWVIKKAIGAADDYPTMIPVPYMLIIIVLFGCGMSQLPSVFLVTSCWLAP